MADFALCVFVCAACSVCLQSDRAFFWTVLGRPPSPHTRCWASCIPEGGLLGRWDDEMEPDGAIAVIVFSPSHTLRLASLGMLTSLVLLLKKRMP